MRADTITIGEEGYLAIGDAIRATPRRAYNAQGMTFDFHRGRIRAAYAAGGKTYAAYVDIDGSLPYINLNNPLGQTIATRIIACRCQLMS